MAKVSAAKPRSLLNGIARFADRGKLDFVMSCLKRSEDFANGAALTALTALDPLRALDHLADVNEGERYLTRNEWLPALLHAQRDLTHHHILELATRNPKGRVLIDNLFWERPDDLDVATLTFVLRALENDLRVSLDTAINGEPTWLYHPFDFLGRIARPELLAVLEAEAGGELEGMVAEIACSRLRTNSNYRDGIREGARRFLLLTGGDRISTLISQELESEHFWVRHGGLQWAFVRQNKDTIERLAALAKRPISRDANGKPDSSAYQEFYQAMIALAALAQDDALVRAIWATGIATVPASLAELRAGNGPMDKSLTTRATQVLTTTAPDEDELTMALTIAWMSGDST